MTLPLLSLTAAFGYALHLRRKSQSSMRQLQGELTALSQKLQELQNHSQSHQQQIHLQAAQAKRHLTQYGVLKGLSESLEWKTLRPRLEHAVREILQIEEFAIYVSHHRHPQKMHLLIKRRLWDSPASSWEHLTQYLQHRGSHPLECKIFPADPSPENGSTRELGISIQLSGELLGYLWGKLPKTSSDSTQTLERAQTFAQELAFALKRIKLFQEVEELSALDGLTGLYRRNYFDDRLHEETLRARTFKTGYSIVLVDLDHFKTINDTYGHPFGDQVLRQVAQILKGAVYETDLAARYGGEEFVLILSRADPVGAKIKAERIRQRIASEPIRSGWNETRITASMGIAHYPLHGQQGSEILARADAALYAAKARGRNCVAEADAF